MISEAPFRFLEVRDDNGYAELLVIECRSGCVIRFYVEQYHDGIGLSE